MKIIYWLCASDWSSSRPLLRATLL